MEQRLSPLVEIRSLAKHFGGLAAVDDVSLDVRRGEILGLIGPNGAGKTTTLNMVGGTLLPTRGRIIFDGEEITRLPPHRRARQGIARVFQQDVVFRSFTVLENVVIGFHLHYGVKLDEIVLRGASALRREEDVREKGLQILRFVGLAPHADEPAANLPHGKQRLLGLAIALAVGPKLLLLDEPVAGMNAEEVQDITSIIRALRDDRGITTVIVEHNMRAVMSLCDRICVLSFGKKIAEGSPGEIAADPTVIEAYLGAEQDVVGS